MNRLQQLLADHVEGHSQLQMDSFITAREHTTPYGYYKQALRELYTRTGSIVEQMIEIEKIKVLIEENISLLNDTTNKFRNQRVNLDIISNQFKVQQLETKLENNKREFVRFYQQADYLKNILGELTPERTHQLDTEHWVNRIKEMAALDYISTGVVGRHTLEITLTLNSDIRKPLLDQLKDPQILVEWLENKQPIEFPQMKQLSQEEVKQLLSFSTDKIEAKINNAIR